MSSSPTFEISKATCFFLKCFYCAGITQTDAIFFNLTTGAVTVIFTPCPVCAMKEVIEKNKAKEKE